MPNQNEELARALGFGTRSLEARCPEIPDLTGYAAWLARGLLDRERRLRAESACLEEAQHEAAQREPGRHMPVQRTPELPTTYERPMTDRDCPFS
jgi:hypothetical protein